jgi:hypothetical protein
MSTYGTDTLEETIKKQMLIGEGISVARQAPVVPRPGDDHALASKRFRRIAEIRQKIIDEAVELKKGGVPGAYNNTDYSSSLPHYSELHTNLEHAIGYAGDALGTLTGPDHDEEGNMREQGTKLKEAMPSIMHSFNYAAHGHTAGLRIDLPMTFHHEMEQGHYSHYQIRQHLYNMPKDPVAAADAQRGIQGHLGNAMTHYQNAKRVAEAAGKAEMKTAAKQG